MPRKISIKGLRKKARRIFARWICKRDKFKCVACGKQGVSGEMQAGHFVHRDCLDFDERNNSAECIRCNCYLSGNLAPYSFYLIKKYGPGIIEELNVLGNVIRKFGREELEEIVKRYSVNESEARDEP